MRKLKWLLGGAAFLSVVAALRPIAAPRRPRLHGPARHLSESDTRKLTKNFLLYFVVPLWLGAGVSDWACHRKARIEQTTGIKETLIHLLMLAEAGVAVLGALFLEINARVLGLMIGAFFAHEATALWDLSYAASRRKVSALEQHVHNYLVTLPLMALSSIAVLHWPKLLALIGWRHEDEPRIQLKKDKLPVSYVATTLSLIALLEVLPYAEEFWRDWRANPATLIPPP